MAEELERQEQERRDQQTRLRTQLEEDRYCRLQALGLYWFAMQEAAGKWGGADVRSSEG